MSIKTCFFVAIAFLPLNANSQRLPYQDVNLSAHERALDLCKRLSIEEKASLMQDNSPAIQRLGIPSFQWWNEALHGVGRNGYATVFPATIGMAASFNDGLIENVFSAVSDEARAKNTESRKSGIINRYQGLSFWTPNINIFRDPRWGRGQETYGEDPYLTTKMGLAVVKGLQGPDSSHYKKLLACAKHFAVHSGPEWSRHSLNLDNLRPRDIWETYLPAFKALVKDGNVAEVMCAYQSIDGKPCCGNSQYLQNILRNEWGFKGLVVSDCNAINDFWQPNRHNYSVSSTDASARAVRAGTDVECGSNFKSLPEAYKNHEISLAEIDSSVVRLLKARFELGDFDTDSINCWTQIPLSVVNNQEHKNLALKVAQESIVLLKNDHNILPLQTTINDLVVMGPNANDSVMQWGNYNGYPKSTITILQGIKNKVKTLKFINGCGLTKNEVSISRFDEIVSKNGKQGMYATYWNNPNLDGAIATTSQYNFPIHLRNGGGTVFAPNVNLESFSARFEGTFIPTRSENVTFSVYFDDGARLIINGDTVANVWKSRKRIQQIKYNLEVVKNKSYKIQIDYFQNKDLGLISFDILHNYEPSIDEILTKIGSSKTIVFIGGISPNLEGEEMNVNEQGFKGGDRTSIELPQAQRSLLDALHKAGKKIIFVNCSGSAVGLLPESHNTDAILQAWYPGEQGGQAVADVLFGDYNPTGKLPITFYKSTEDLPDFENYDMNNRTYRYFKGEALYPFGYGLSYTKFSIGNIKIKHNKVYATISNIGNCFGGTTLQLYMKRITDVNGPIKSLIGFRKVYLKQGETKTVLISELTHKLMETWDEGTNSMHFMPGKYALFIGYSSKDEDLIPIYKTFK